MIEETVKVRQIDNEPKRRWFSDDCFDLIVFLDKAGNPNGFHLSYEKHQHERILVYDEINGYSHGGIDDGEERMGKMKSSPIMITDGIFEKDNVASSFKKVSSNIDSEIADYVLQWIKRYSQ